MRNFICGNIKRDDPVSRRFIQYLSMETWEVHVLVRDPKTGHILVQPPEEELWLLREKSGWGRESRNEFKILHKVDTAFFEQMDKLRDWHFSFQEYYEVYLWDAAPGRPVSLLQRKLEETMSRAIRVRELTDMFLPAREVLKTIHKDPKTGRCTTVTPENGLRSLWDVICDGGAHATTFHHDTKEAVEGMLESYKYTEADELEDAILFPDEGSKYEKDNLFREKLSMVDRFERKPMLDVRRFAADADTDDEFSDEGSDESSEEAKSDDGDDAWLTDDTEASDSHEKSEHNWINKYEDEVMDAGAADKALGIFKNQFKSTSLFQQEPDYFLPILKNPSTARDVPASIRNHPADLMATLRLSLMNQRSYDNMTDLTMQADFLRHIDREKSKGKSHICKPTLCSASVVQSYIKLPTRTKY